MIQYKNPYINLFGTQSSFAYKIPYKTRKQIPKGVNKRIHKEGGEALGHSPRCTKTPPGSALIHAICSGNPPFNGTIEILLYMPTAALSSFAGHPPKHTLPKP